MRRPIQHCLALIALELSAPAVAQEHSPTVLGAGAYTIPVYAGRLFGDAADSPITQRRTTAGGGAFLAYLVR